VADKIEKTPLEAWIRARISSPEDVPFTRSLVRSYQMRKLAATFTYVKEKSPFYRDLFSGLAEPMDFDGFSHLPFTNPRDIREKGLKMLCVSQDEIERVVTLATSGTTGEAKRLFFTGDDLELTIDFFAHGMTTMVAPGDTVIIFLPGLRPDSVGDLLARALLRIGAKPVIHGPVSDLAAAWEEVRRHPGACLVGIPSQMLSLARSPAGGPVTPGLVGSALLSTDYVPATVVRELERLWGCAVFSHYGMTEMGYGGGVECKARAGYHVREADLYFEIVNPDTGKGVQDGTWGEVVFSALTRRGMPLVRYRTGDSARIISDPCPCGSMLRRLSRVRGRIGEEVSFAGNVSLGIEDLDEALFGIDGVLNYTAEVASTGRRDELRLCFYAREGTEEGITRAAKAALYRAPVIRGILESGALALGDIIFCREDWFTTGAGKRKLADTRARQ
jgi:phenylacetate-CoA ligase